MMMWCMLHDGVVHGCIVLQLDLAEFVETIIRLSATAIDGKLSDVPLQAKFDSFLTKYVIPNAKRFQVDNFREVNTHQNQPVTAQPNCSDKIPLASLPASQRVFSAGDVQKALRRYHGQLFPFFVRIAAGDSRSAEDDTMNVAEARRISLFILVCTSESANMAEMLVPWCCLGVCGMRLAGVAFGDCALGRVIVFTVFQRDQPHTRARCLGTGCTAYIHAGQSASPPKTVA